VVTRSGPIIRPPAVTHPQAWLDWYIARGKIEAAVRLSRYLLERKSS
jgi:hypothetical protein